MCKEKDKLFIFQESDQTLWVYGHATEKYNG